MDLNHDLELAELTDHALGQPNFRLVDFATSRSQCIGNIAGSHGTKQLTFFSCSGCDLDCAQPSQRLATGFRGRQRLRCCCFKLCTAGLKLGHVVFCGWHRLALRDQEIAAVTGLHINLVTQRTETTNVFEQNDFHRSFLCWPRERPTPINSCSAA